MMKIDGKDIIVCLCGLNGSDRDYKLAMIDAMIYIQAHNSSSMNSDDVMLKWFICCPGGSMRIARIA
jgi:hypothetical protein